MSEFAGSETSDRETQREIETRVLGSFGHSIIEFETILFQKFLLVAGPYSVMTKEQFRQHLQHMHSKGYISPIDFQGRRSWKLLVAGEDPESHRKHVHPEVAKIQTKKRIRGRYPVSQPRVIAEDLTKTIESKLFFRRPMTTEEKDELHRHIEAMRRELTMSQEGFLEYVEENLPTIRKSVEFILRSKGVEILLPALRIMECEMS